MAATVLRIGFASITVQLMQVIGLLLAGGLLLLWVCWKMWQELRNSHDIEAPAEPHVNADGTTANGAPRKTMGQAIWQVIIADISMSLDNVLAVVGAARDHPWVLAFALVLPVALMGIAAGFVARLLQKHRWIAYAGLAIILYVALDMIYRGGYEVWPMAKPWPEVFDHAD